MKILFRIMFKNKLLNNLLQRIFINLHNFSYKVISISAVIQNKGLHPKHRIMNYHQFFVDNIKKGEKVLDIGCGNGALAFDVAKKASKIVCIDISKENIKTARKNYYKENIDYIIGDATKHPFSGKFDVVILSNVLEHLNNRVEFMNQIKNLADKFIIRVPLIDRGWLTLYKKENGFEYRLDKDHKIEYTLESFKDEIKQAGLKLKKYQINFGELWGVVD